MKLPLQLSNSSKTKAKPLSFPRPRSYFIPTTLFQPLPKSPQGSVLDIIPNTAAFTAKLQKNTIQATSTTHIDMTVTPEHDGAQPLVAHPSSILRPLSGRPKFVANSPRRETSHPTVRHHAETKHANVHAQDLGIQAQRAKNTKTLKCKGNPVSFFFVIGAGFTSTHNPEKENIGAQSVIVIKVRTKSLLLSSSGTSKLGFVPRLNQASTTRPNGPSVKLGTQKPWLTSRESMIVHENTPLPPRMTTNDHTMYSCDYQNQASRARQWKLQV